MFEQDNVCIQNLQGEFIIHILQKEYESISDLFWEDGTYAAPDDGIMCRGKEQIFRFFTEIFPQEKKNLYVFSHTPAIRIEENGERARATWYANTIEIKRDKEFQAIQGSARFDADLEKRNGIWKYTDLQFFYLMTLKPQAYETENVLFEKDPFIFRFQKTPRPVDFVDIEHLIGRWCQNRRLFDKDIFVDSKDSVLRLPNLLSAPAKGAAEIKEALEMLHQKEQELLPYPLSLPTVSAPMIYSSDDDSTAEGHWFMLSFEGKKVEDAFIITPSFGGLYVELEKESEWKLKKLEYRIAAVLPDMVMEAKDNAGTVISTEEAWMNGPQETGNRSDEAVSDILALEEYLTFWVSGLRYRSEAPFYYTRLALERPEMITYKVRANEARGLEEATKAIFARTNKFSTLQPKAPGTHVGTTPVIEISKDGKTAEAEWIDYGWTTVAEVFGITEPPYLARMTVARYFVKYLKIDGMWKQYGFHWTPFFTMGMLQFDYNDTKGWSGTASTKRFPLPYERYIYENDPSKKGMKIKLDPPLIDCPYEKEWDGGTDRL